MQGNSFSTWQTVNMVDVPGYVQHYSGMRKTNGRIIAQI
jgi:hypothetical protein